MTPKEAVFISSALYVLTKKAEAQDIPINPAADADSGLLGPVLAILSGGLFSLAALYHIIKMCRSKKAETANTRTEKDLEKKLNEETPLLLDTQISINDGNAPLPRATIY